MSSFCFHLLSHGERSQPGFHPGLWHSGAGGLAVNQAGTHGSFGVGYTASCVRGRDFPCTPKRQGPHIKYPTVLNVALISAFSDKPVAPVISHRVTALLAGV